MTDPTTKKNLDDLAEEIKPYASELGLYALTVGQAFALIIATTIRARETGKKNQEFLPRWIMSQMIENHPELIPIIKKYDELLAQLEKTE